MAKEDDSLKYLQLPLPAEARKTISLKVNWSGLNRSRDLGTGELYAESNISTAEAPALTPCPRPIEIFNGVANEGIPSPIGLWGFDDFLIVLCNMGTPEAPKIGAIRLAEDGDVEETAVFPTSFTSTKPKYEYTNPYKSDMRTERCVVAMNLYENGLVSQGGVISGKYIKKLLVFPDRISMDFDLGDNGLNAAIIPSAIMPNIKYATVHLSRLYGAAAPEAGEEPDRLCVSAYNDYANWDLDTDDDFSEAHAWYSAAQSNVRATGSFTGITTYLNSVVAFKRDYMHEVVGSSNPFRINDVFSEGAINNRCIVEVDGTLFFESDDAVKVYTGGNPRIMSYKLGIDRFSNPVAGTDGRCYYLYCEDNGSRHLFVYDTMVMEWAEEHIDDVVVSFARTDNGLYMLTRHDDGTGSVYRMDTGIYTDQPWSAETDLSLSLNSKSGTVDIKHIQKFQMLAEIAPGSWLAATLIYNDGSGTERSSVVFRRRNNGNKTIRVPIRVIPRLTAHWGARLRLEGEGWVKVYQIELTAKAGGELFKTLRLELDE